MPDEYTPTLSIPLTQGKVAIIDAEDWPLVSGYQWFARKSPTTYYATANGEYIGSGRRRRQIQMHALILGTKRGQLVDHVDGDGLNNRRENLRIASRRQNAMNRSAHRNNSSGYRGVSFFKPGGKWRARIMVNYKMIHLGHFLSPEDAARAYDDAAREYHGEFAAVNFPKNGERSARREGAAS